MVVPSSSRLGELFSPERDLKSLNTHKDPRLDEKSTKKNTKISSQPRLGEPLSPKQESLSLNISTTSLDRKIAFNP
ncbi:hypothetical protein DEO72_LG9g1481 [Vigna unguiculata]|uniref:Uncharacterized protein n=1 Tax=Vigna unguiculata TaxID=3917 RepID=A0A4D6N1X0_VIGUN|nr:hypothetical protein DEO72_LG9g1481 [Vigna unguiculata]